jgi:hypothetical protein
VQHYVIKFVSDLPNVGGFFWGGGDIQISSTNKTDRHDITEILLKVALTPSNKQTMFSPHFLGLQICSFTFAVVLSVLLDIWLLTTPLVFSSFYFTSHGQQNN